MIAEELSIIGLTPTCTYPRVLGRDTPALLLYADTEVQLAPGDLGRVRTGIQICLPTGYWAETRPIQVMTSRLLEAKVELLETVSTIGNTTSSLINHLPSFFRVRVLATRFLS